VICKLSLALLSLLTVNTVTHSYGTSAVLSQLWLDKDIQKPLRHFPVSNVFFPLPCKISLSKVWVDRKFQASSHTHYFILHSDKIPLNSLLNFAVIKLTMVPIYCCTVVQTLSKIHEKELFWFVKKCESASTCRLLCIISLLPWGHTLRRNLECFLHTVFLQFTVHYEPCNKLEVSVRQF